MIDQIPVSSVVHLSKVVNDKIWFTTLVSRSSIYGFNPATAVINNLGRILVTYAFGDYRNHSVIGIVTYVCINWISHFTKAKTVKNSCYINVDVSYIYAQP